jgi:hypothetical protein
MVNPKVNLVVQWNLTSVAEGVDLDRVQRRRVPPDPLLKLPGLDEEVT